MKVSIWKVLLGLLIVALLVGGGAALYSAGYARGVMSDMSFEDMPQVHANIQGSMPYHGAYGMRGFHGPFGYFPLGRMILGGIVFFLIVGSLFRLFGMRRYGYMPPWAMHKMHREGKGGPWMHHDHPYWGKMKPEGDDEADKEEEPKK